MDSITSSGKSASKKSAARAGASGDEYGSVSRHHVDRASATSPSAVSTSTEDEGGVRLDTRVGNMSLDNSPAGTTYAHPAARQGHATPDFARSLRGPSGLRNSPSFQVGTAPDDGDVFVSPTKQDPARLSPDKALHNDRAMIATGPQDMTSPQSVRSGDFGTPMHTLRYKTSQADLGGARHQVGGVDAQSFYPSTACVFVANLPEGVKDSRLEAEVTRHFSKFGVVFVKIRRDQKNMPFAFCQYTKDEDAKVAMTHGKGTIIHGRACRTEMVKANRTYILYNCNGGDVGPEEAREVLAAFGPLTKCLPLDLRLREALNLGDSVLIEFLTFDPSRDIQAAFRHHSSYRVMAYDPKKASQGPKVDSDEVFLKRYEVERRSIFIGNLPADVDDLDEKIRAVFEEVGDVVNVQVVRKEGKGGSPAVFSFVEFARPDMAEVAVKRLGNAMLFGANVRIERKENKEHGVRRARSNMVLSDAYRSTPRDQHFSSSQQSIQAGGLPTKSENTAQANESPVPLTPLRPQVLGNDHQNSGSPAVSSATQPMANPYWVPYPGQNYASPNYTTSPPYGAPVGASPYTAATPQGSTPQGFQGTPQGYTSPYNYYQPQPYSWATPYMQDPNFAAAAYNHTFGQMPIPATRTDDGVPDTPTKTTSAGIGEATGSHGGDGA